MFKFLKNTVMLIVTFWLLIALLTLGTSLMTTVLLATM